MLIIEVVTLHWYISLLFCYSLWFPGLHMKLVRLLVIKDHRQRIPRFVIRRYLERSIQKKFFSNLQSLQMNTIFQEKTQFAKIYCRGM